MAAQAQVQVLDAVTTVQMPPKVSKAGTPGFWGQARVTTREGTRYLVQVSAWELRPKD